jgi:type IV secretion system protein VirB4
VTRIKNFFEDYRSAGAFHRLVNIETALDEHILAGKTGDLVMLAAVSAQDPECLDPEQKNAIARCFEASLRIFDDHFRCYQYLIKSEHPGVSGDHHPNATVEEAIQNRLHYLNANTEKLWRIETFIAIVYEGWHPADAKGGLSKWLAGLRGLSPQASEHELSVVLDQARDVFRNKVTQWVHQCRDVIDLRVMNVGEAFTLLRRFLNYAPEKAEPIQLKSPHFLDVQAVSSELECHRDYLRLDDLFIQVLSLKEPPTQTFAGMFAGLVALRSSFILASEWRREDTGMIRSLIHSRRRHFHNSKKSLANYLPSGSADRPGDALIDTSAVARVDDLGSCLTEIEVNGRSFGEYSISLILYNRDLALLKAATGQAFKIFASFDAHLIEERYNRLNSWLAHLPANSAFNLRRFWVTDANAADLSFLFAPDTGSVRNPHLGSEYLVALETESRVPYYLNLHCPDVAHTIVLGNTGSGKSFTLNFLITHLQKYNPRTVIFDLGGSYEDLTALLGGAYLSLRPNNRRFTINPFCLPLTPENRGFLLSLTRVLIESSGYRMSAAEEQDLYEQIGTLYQIEPRERRISTLARIVQRPLRAPLERWVQGGPYGDVFDNPDDTLTFAELQTFDFEGMEDHQEQLEPLLFYILPPARNFVGQFSGNI